MITVNEAFGVKPVFRFSPTNRLVMPALAVGIEIEVEGWTDEDPSIYLGGKKANGINVSWVSDKDESLKDYGREFKAGPICGGDLVTAIEDFCLDASRRKFKISQRTGLHIHLDCTSGKNAKFLGNLVSVYMAVEPMLFSYCGEWRRWCGFCHSFYDATLHIPNLRKMITAKNKNELTSAVKQIGRYSGLNLLSLTKFGTVEFRLLQTTFSAEDILFCINLCQSIYAAAEDLTEADQTIFGQYKKQGPEATVANILGCRSKEVWKKMKPHYNEKEFMQCLHRVRTLGMDPFASFSTEPKGERPKFATFDFDPYNSTLEDILAFSVNENKILTEFLKDVTEATKKLTPKKAKDLAEQAKKGKTAKVTKLSALLSASDPFDTSTEF